MIIEQTSTPDQYNVWPDDDRTKGPMLVVTRPGQDPADVLAEAAAAEPTPAPARYIEVATVRERLEAAGLWAAAAAALAADPATLLRVTTLRHGIDPADPEARALITAIGGDPDVILAS